MKATLWLWTLIAIATLLCTQCIAAPHYGDSRYLRENFISPKRTKPSLSIVNPLDVLRQRIMLEMARRQMRENTKQVEMNKAILKTIGKRGNQQSGELNNEYDLDYSILDDYYPHARFYYETPFQHQHPRDPTTSLLNNIFNLNNNVLSNKHQLKNVHSNKETAPLLTVDDKNPEALSDTSSDHGNNNNNNNNISNNQGSQQVKSDNKNSNLDQLDDVKNNVDDNELQLKYLYSLYRNRFDNF